MNNEINAGKKPRETEREREKKRLHALPFM